MLSIVVPTRNERDSVAALAERVRRAMGAAAYEIVFVDDSSDGTDARLAEIARRDRHVRYEHRAAGRGLGSAVLRGFALAHGDLLAVMDGDLQHPPELLPDLMRAIGSGADVAIASRFAPGGADCGLDARRRLVSALARGLGRLALPCLRNVSDPTSGFFLCRRSVVAGAALRPIGWKVLIEVLARGRHRVVREVAYAFEARAAGRSKLGARDLLDYLRQLAGLAPLLHGSARHGQASECGRPPGESAFSSSTGAAATVTAPPRSPTTAAAAIRCRPRRVSRLTAGRTRS